MKSISIEIDGVTPLLLNRFTDKQQMDASGSTRATLIGDRGSPQEQAESKLYVGLDGKLMVPQPNLYRAIIDAGIHFKAGRTKVTTQKTSLIPACLEINGLEIPIIHRDPWCVDSRPVRIPATGGRILCHRPVFHDWKLRFTVEIDTEMMSAKLLRDIFDAAGKRVGLGDFRPACKGPFGKFVVTKWAEEKEMPKSLKKAA